MRAKLMLPLLFLAMAWLLWQSPDASRIAAGVAIFMFGMRALEDGFRAFTGGVLENLLRISTNQPWKSFLFGVVSTAIFQSSALVSLITLSFLSAGLVPLVAAIGIIFGANIGTTSGAWLLAGVGLKVDIASWSMPMLAFGVLFSFQRSSVLQGTGSLLAGIGFLFLGIDFMKAGVEAVQDQLDLVQYAMPGVRGLLVFTVLGVLATVVMQSSHATLLLTLSALATGQLTYENALAVAVGANVGTTVTAVIGAIGANVAGRRLAAVHLAFNLVTGIVALSLMKPLVWLVEVFSVWLGIAHDDYTLHLALFHTLFNVLGVLLMWPQIPRMVRLLERWLPDQPPNLPVEAGAPVEPRFLSDSALAHPDTALQVMIDETGHFLDETVNVIAYGLYIDPGHLEARRVLAALHAPDDLSGYERDLETLYQQRLKGLYSAIIEFGARAQGSLKPAQAAVLQDLRSSLRRLVDAVRQIRQLRANLARHVTGNHPVARRQYNQLRQALGLVLAQIRLLREQPAEEAYAELDRLRLFMERQARRQDDSLDVLVREHALDGRLATSLLNDMYGMRAAADDLASAVLLLQGASATGQRPWNGEVQLSDDDFGALLARLEASED